MEVIVAVDPTGAGVVLLVLSALLLAGVTDAPGTLSSRSAPTKSEAPKPAER